MLRDKLSWWEDQYLFDNLDYIIIGGGIVGLSTAIELKSNNPKHKILIIDKQSYPVGASTRNAGFACFGSISEILDDIGKFGESICQDLIKMRYDGLSILKERVSLSNMNYKNNGGAEIFNNQEDFDHYESKIPYLNDFVADTLGIKDCFSVNSGPFGNEILNQYEGSIFPHMMMAELTKIAKHAGVLFLHGIEITKIDIPNHTIITNKGTILYPKLIVCTNGFSEDLIHNSTLSIDLKPARNQVLVTNPILNFSIGPCYHMDCGYVYFRAIDNRLLIGGGRNTDFKVEATSDLNQTNEIISYLTDIINTTIAPNCNVKIEKQWSGIMGVGSTKMPIVTQLPNDIFLAIRMGGMGVAIGSYIGRLTAKSIN